ncbi:MAG TPA: hypothetical protein VFC71_06435 [Candidatus Polarisedimenticolia bacterium]|nr:hypothetical protein [Candidatus Polarisedimenticolia bacterium]
MDSQRIQISLPKHVVETGRELTLREFESVFAGKINADRQP